MLLLVGCYTQLLLGRLRIGLCFVVGLFFRVTVLAVQVATSRRRVVKSVLPLL
jgi:hypothetical protein